MVEYQPRDLRAEIETVISLVFADSEDPFTAREVQAMVETQLNRLEEQADRINFVEDVLRDIPGLRQLSDGSFVFGAV